MHSVREMCVYANELKWDLGNAQVMAVLTILLVIKWSLKLPKNVWNWPFIIIVLNRVCLFEYFLFIYNYLLSNYGQSTLLKIKAIYI